MCVTQSRFKRITSFPFFGGAASSKAGGMGVKETETEARLISTERAESRNDSRSQFTCLRRKRLALLRGHFRSTSSELAAQKLGLKFVGFGLGRKGIGLNWIGH